MPMVIIEEQKVIRLNNFFFSALAPPPELRIWEWADKYRILTSEASSEPGPWRTDRFPFTKEIMEVLSPQHPAKDIGCMKGSQIAMTETMLNFMGYTIHYNPNPMLYIQKTVDAVKRFEAQRFKKSLEASPEIAKLLPETKSRDDTNTKLLKNFPGGLLVLGGANSAASLRSMPICFLLEDELDSFESSIEEEGDPTKLAEKRTTNFPRRKIYKISTPLVKETSKIEPFFKSGDQRYYKVPCPYCGFKQVITWEHIIYDDNNPKTAKLVCIECGMLIEERFKTQMLMDGEWIPKYPGRETITFHISALYSPLGFYSWADAVKDWLEWKQTRDIEKLRVFINTTLGETFSDANKSVEVGMFDSRKEIYKAEVPNDVYALTAGVDVQEDRIECEIVGWGTHQESWSIDYSSFVGDVEYDDVWNRLDEHLLKTWEHESGAKLMPVCTAIDSGHKARIVYNFCKAREHRRIYPLKGKEGWGQGVLRRPKKRNEDRVFLFLAFVDELKSRIYSQLKLETAGPGYCHFPMKQDQYDNDYFRMLTAEKLIRKRTGNKYKLVWELPSGRRNEALDCRCYAMCALNILKPNFELLKKKGRPITLGQRKKVVQKKRVLSQGIQV